MTSQTSHQPLLSIVIATFNASEFLPRTLKSLSVQPRIDSPDVEVLIIDGASTDQTLEQVADHEFIGKVSSERDDGIYDAMNKGARLASGRWIQFLNAGDSFTDSSSLDEVLRTLAQADSGAVPWVVSAARNLGGSTGIIRRIPSVPHVWWRHAYGLQPHCHQATWFRRSTFIDSGAHALKFGTADDFDVVLRFGLLAPPIVVDKVIIDYLGGGVSERTSALGPTLQHMVRVDRFQLGPIGRSLDMCVGNIIGIWNEFRKFAGKLRPPVK